MQPPATPPGSSAIADLWRRLDAALARDAPLVKASLHPPLAEGEVEAAWVAQHDPAGVGITSAYRAHNGGRQAGGLLSLLPTAAAAPWTRVTTWLTARAAQDELSRLTAAFGSERAQRLFPLSRWGAYRPADPYDAGQELCVAVDTSTGELHALIYHEYADASQAIPLGVTWASYLAELLRALEAGELRACRDDYQVLRLEPRPAPQPARIPPRSDADVLVELLCERGLLRLQNPPTLPFLAEVGRALRKRSTTGRIAALRQAFAEYEEVFEDYCSDEELIALVTLVRGS